MAVGWWEDGTVQLLGKDLEKMDVANEVNRCKTEGEVTEVYWAPTDAPVGGALGGVRRCTRGRYYGRQRNGAQCSNDFRKSTF